jgi:hypothetical protein
LKDRRSSANCERVGLPNSEAKANGEGGNTRPSSFANDLETGSAFILDIPGLWDAPVVENFNRDAARNEESAANPNGRDRSTLDSAIHGTPTTAQGFGKFGRAERSF